MNLLSIKGTLKVKSKLLLNRVFQECFIAQNKKMLQAFNTITSVLSL